MSSILRTLARARKRSGFEPLPVREPADSFTVVDSPNLALIPQPESRDVNVVLDGKTIYTFRMVGGGPIPPSCVLAMGSPTVTYQCEWDGMQYVAKEFTPAERTAP